MERFSIPAIAAGAAVAALINFAAGLVQTLLSEPAAEISYTATIIVAVVGLVAYVIGGYIAGRMSGGYGGLNGLAVVVVGFVIGLILDFIVGIFTATGAGDTNMDPSSVNMQAAAIASVIAFGSFLLNFAVGYLGGKLGERSGGSSRQLA